MRNIKTEIIKNALRRFRHLPLKTIARHIANTEGDLWDNDLEKIRDQVRYYAGSKGKYNFDEAQDKSLFRDAVIKMPATWRKVRTPYCLTPGPWLVIQDLHVPFHEPKPIEAAIRYAQDEKVSGVFINGDLQDCSALSYWKAPKRDFNGEIEKVLDFLDFLDGELPKTRKVYKPGNHEYRLPAYFMSHAIEAAESPLAAMETLMGFESRGIEFLDYYQIVRAGKLPIIHGHEIPRIDRSVNPARGLFNRTHTWALCGHCHTTSVHTERDLNGTVITTWSIGCMCDLSPDYTAYCNRWNWGFALINVAKNGDFEVRNFRILPNGKVVPS